MHLLNVSNWSVVGDAAMSVPNLSLDHSLRDAITDTQKEAFDTLAERYGVDEKHRHLLTGIPYRVIETVCPTERVQPDGAGYVLPSRPRRFYRRHGANALINRAPCSLMMVRPSRPHG